MKPLRLAALSFLLLCACNRPASGGGLDAADRLVAKGELDSAARLYETVLKSGDDARALRGLGLVEQYRWRWPESRALLERAVKLDATDPIIRISLAMALVAVREPDAARAQAQYLVERHAELGSGQLLLALLADTPERARAALTQLEALAVLPAGHKAEVHLALADLRMRVGEPVAARTQLQTANTLPLADASSALRLSFLYGRLGRFEAARQLAEAVVRARPDHLEALHQLAQVAIEQGDAQRAHEALQQLPEQLRETPRFDRLRGRVLLLRNDSAAALPLLQRAATALSATERDSAEGVQLRLWLAQAQGGTGDLAGARAGLEQLSQLPQASVDVWLTLADVQLRMGDEAAAIKLLEEVATRPGMQLQALETLGRIHQGAARFDAAVSTFALLVKLAPNNAQAASLHGQALRSLGNREAALAELLRAVELDPTRVDALVAALALQDEAGQSAAADALVESELKRRPDSTTLHVLAGDRHRSFKRTAEARSAYQQALKLDESFVPAWLRLAELSRADNEPVKALALYEDALRHEANNPEALLAAGTLQVQLGNLDQAEGHFEMLQRVRPDSTTALNNLAYLWTRKPERRADARQLAEKARTIDAKSPHTADTLGWIMHLQGEHDGALPLLQEAASALPAEPLVHFHLGMALLAAGQASKGKAELQRALRLSSEFEGADEARKAL